MALHHHSKQVVILVDKMEDLIKLITWHLVRYKDPLILILAPLGTSQAEKTINKLVSSV
jgi:hypothetical protein